MKTLIAGLLVLALSPSYRAQPPPDPSPPAPATTAKDTAKEKVGPDRGAAAVGEPIYFRYCAACHGRSLKGDGPVAMGLRSKPADLTQLAKKARGTFPFDKVAAMIDGRQTSRMHGTPDMPVWGEVFAITTGTGAATVDDAVKRITHYVWSMQTKPKEEAEN